jgi:hypothetical protein
MVFVYTELVGSVYSTNLSANVWTQNENYNPFCTRDYMRYTLKGASRPQREFGTGPENPLRLPSVEVSDNPVDSMRTDQLLT